MVKQIVGGLAYDICEAGDGGEAIAVCAEERPAWVLMDVRMKPIDGLRATAVIKTRFPETRIVIVSQFDDGELRAEADRAGACAYVLKDDLQQLRGILGEPGVRPAQSQSIDQMGNKHFGGRNNSTG